MRKLAAGDMIATDSQYRLKCLQSVYRRAEHLGKKASTERESTSACHGIAFSDQVSYFLSFEDDSTTAPAFQMSQLCSL